jgi:Protein of unknown function (DUF1460)
MSSRSRSTWTAMLMVVAFAGSAAAESPAAEQPAIAAADPQQVESIRQAGLDPDKILPLLDKPLYQFTEAEVDLYLRYLQASEPDLRRRIVKLARQNIGQPYQLFLLGEMPFEPYDPQPLYCLTKSDCVVFSEHTYAMALSADWPSFMAMLQRIRYRDGQIGVATRNHYTEADWNISNRWLVRDITADIAGDAAVKFEQEIDRAKFLKSRYGLVADLPVESHQDIYLPYTELTRTAAQLRDGDFVNVVRGTSNEDDENRQTFGGSAFVGHVGLVAIGPDGTVNFLHSSEPAVREEPLVDYIARQNADRETRLKEGKPVLLGFKFLRLEADPLANLKQLDGDQAPRVTLPRGGEAKF